MKTDLKFDTDAFQKAIQDYDNLIDDMERLKNQLQREIESLKDVSWRSEAGEKFQNQYEDTWKKNVETYTDFLRHLTDTLRTVKVQYGDLYQEAGRLKLP